MLYWSGYAVPHTSEDALIHTEDDSHDDKSLSVMNSTPLRVHLRIDATHALLTHALVVSVNTDATEYSFTA